MINQLPFDGLKRLFLAMELEDKSQLMGMVDEKRKDNLKKELTPDQLNDLFLFAHFELTQKTSMKSKEFIQEQLDEYTCNNN